MQVRNFEDPARNVSKLNCHGNVEVASGATLVFLPLKISSAEPYTGEKSAPCNILKCAVKCCEMWKRR